MKYILFLVFLLCSGCVCLNPTHKRLLSERTEKPPITDTGKVKERIDETRNELSKAGESSQGISKSVNKAQSLTERVDKILEELDKQEQK
jgi:hypothetical protein